MALLNIPKIRTSSNIHLAFNQVLLYSEAIFLVGSSMYWPSSVVANVYVLYIGIGGLLAIYFDVPVFGPKHLILGLF